MLLLVEKLSCHSCKFVSVYRLQTHFLWLQIEQKLHIGGECQQVTNTPNIVVSELDEMLYAMSENHQEDQQQDDGEDKGQDESQDNEAGGCLLGGLRRNHVGWLRSRSDEEI